MAKQIRCLTETFIRQGDLPPGKYSDGDGLSFRVRKSGTRYWQLRLRVNDRTRDFGLGGFPVVTLNEARNLVKRYQFLASEGKDPSPRSSGLVPTVRELALVVVEDQTPHWKNPKAAERWLQIFENYISGPLGKRPVSDIRPSDVLRVLTPLWSDKHATAAKVRNCLRAILAKAVAGGYLDTNPAGKAISPVLVRGKKEESHFPAAPYDTVARVLHAVDRSGASLSTKLSLRFQVLTAARLGEVRAARWSEMDSENRMWIVPKDRMKTGVEHRVPLSPQAIAVLAEARVLVGASTDLVFPSPRGNMLSDATHSKLLRVLGFPWVPHGFRSSFCDWCGDNGIEHDLAQACLAHSNRDPYFRSDIIERRRHVMESWANYLDETARALHDSDEPASADFSPSKSPSVQNAG